MRAIAGRVSCRHGHSRARANAFGCARSHRFAEERKNALHKNRYTMAWLPSAPSNMTSNSATTSTQLGCALPRCTACMCRGWLANLCRGTQPGRTCACSWLIRRRLALSTHARRGAFIRTDRLSARPFQRLGVGCAHQHLHRDICASEPEEETTPFRCGCASHDASACTTGVTQVPNACLIGLQAHSYAYGHSVTFACCVGSKCGRSKKGSLARLCMCGTQKNDHTLEVDDTERSQGLPRTKEMDVHETQISPAISLRAAHLDG